MADSPPDQLTWVNPRRAEAAYPVKMLIGVPKEIKVHEYRVGLTPESVRELVARGHRVIVERNAGEGIGASDGDYGTAGAAIA